MKKVFTLFLILFLYTPSLLAYNFLYIHPTTGEPITWEQGTTIEYYLDPGSLGRLTNDQAHTLLQEAMKIWEGASPYANVPHFSFAGYLPEDVTGENYQDYVSLFQCYTDDLESCPSQAQKDLQTVIVFDEDGAILDNELCRITACSASAGAKVFSGSQADPSNIVQGIAVFGSFAGSAETKISAVMGQFTHELGHLLGLAHTVVNQEAVIEDLGDLGLFMPSLLAGSVPRAEANSESLRVTLHPDDIAGITVLYPSDDMAANTATIQGEILKLDLTPMMHVNVIARNTEDPLCEAYSFLTARSCESDQQGCETLAGLGELPNPGFTIAALPPGSYTIEVEEIADDNLGQTLAPGLLPSEDISGDAEFWNEGETANEENVLSSVITLSAGEIREDVDIILNRSEVTNDRIQYIPLSTFEAGPGTRCPKEPSIDYAELIGIEEGSEEGNSDSGSDNPDSDPTDNSNFQGGCSLMKPD